MKMNEVFCNTFKALRKQIDFEEIKKQTDFMLPSLTMINACRADEFDFFLPWIEAGKLTEGQMHLLAQRYFLGKTKSGLPMFWMIDDTLTPLDAHIGTDSWLSMLLKKREPILNCWKVQHCLFGLHLLSMELPAAGNIPVSIVESETSAVVLSGLFPESLWLSYATTSHIVPDLLAPLKGCTVRIFPRTDSTMSTYLFFKDLTNLVRKKYDIDIYVDATLEEFATEDQKSRGIDILDFLYEASKPSESSVDYLRNQH